MEQSMSPIEEKILNKVDNQNLTYQLRKRWEISESLSEANER